MAAEVLPGSQQDLALGRAPMSASLTPAEQAASQVVALPEIRVSSGQAYLGPTCGSPKAAAAHAHSVTGFLAGGAIVPGGAAQAWQAPNTEDAVAAAAGVPPYVMHAMSPVQQQQFQCSQLPVLPGAGAAPAPGRTSPNKRPPPPGRTSPSMPPPQPYTAGKPAVAPAGKRGAAAASGVPSPGGTLRHSYDAAGATRRVAGMSVHPADMQLAAYRPGTTSIRPVFTKYSWDSDYQRALLDAAQRLPADAVPAGFMAALSSTLPPPSEGPPLEPDPAALRWFKETYPDAVSTHRRDALAVRAWLEDQVWQLRRSLGAPPRPQSAPHGSAGSGPDSPGAGARSASGNAHGFVATAVPSVPGSPNAHHAQQGQAQRHASPDRVQHPAAHYGGHHRTVSPDRHGAEHAAGNAAGNGPPAAAPFLGAPSMLLVRDQEGYLNAAVLRHQETLLSKAMVELSGQVATLCVERGHLIAMLWEGLASMVHALVADRDTARVWAREARRAAAQAAAEKTEALARIEAEKTGMNDMNDLLNRRLLTARVEVEHVKARTAEMDVELNRLRAVQPDELRSQLDLLRQQVAVLEKQASTTQARLERCQVDLAERDKDLALALSRLQVTSEELEAMGEEFALRSPRPAQPKTPPWELLSAEEARLTLAALRAGCPAVDMHRMLLAVSPTGSNLLPWFHLLGCCRSLDPNGLPPNAPPPTGADGLAVGGEGSSGGMDGGADGGGSSGGAVPATPSGSSPLRLRAANKLNFPRTGPLAEIAQEAGSGAGGGGPQSARASTSTSAPRRFNRIMSRKSLMVPNDAAGADSAGGAGGSGARGGAGGLVLNLAAVGPSGGGAGAAGSRRSAAAVVLNLPQLPDLREQHAWLLDLLSRPDPVPGLAKWLSEEVIDAISQMMNHSIDANSIACLLLGTLSAGGFEMTPYKAVGGVLASRYSHTAADVGGGITQALELAAMSTRDRVERLQGLNAELHREAVKLRRNLNDMRKVEREGRMAEIRQGARKVQGRRPSPLQAFVLQKRPEYFLGLGAQEGVPTVLAVEGKFYNRGMEKADAERLVHAVWQGKREFESSYGLRITLQDYLVVSLQRKHGTARGAAEAAYNLVYTLGQHQYDPDCHLFLKVLMGDLDERAREEQDALRSSLLEALIALDSVKNSGNVTGWLRKSDMRDTLRALLGPSKTELQLDDLFDALDSDEPHEMVQYGRLFEDDQDLNQGVFVETLRQQQLHERLEWLQAIEDALLDWAEGPGNGGPVTLGVLRSALLKAHPDADVDAQKEVMTRVFGEAGAAAVMAALDKGAKPTRGKKEEGAGPMPLELALRKLRQDRCEAACTIAQAMELLSGGARKGGGRHGKRASEAGGSPRTRAAAAGKRPSGSNTGMPGSAGGVGGGGGIMWADGAGGASATATPREDPSELASSRGGELGSGGATARESALGAVDEDEPEGV